MIHRQPSIWGRNVEAEAELHAAIRIDPAFAEVWYNLGNLLDDQGRSEAAIESLRKAVQVAPDYGDAMFNGTAAATKKSMCRGGRLLAALSRYRRPVRMASRARRSLKFCEMQQYLIV
jgi:tetratricopeptide (TPR) repeat protein